METATLFGFIDELEKIAGPSQFLTEASMTAALNALGQGPATRLLSNPIKQTYRHALRERHLIPLPLANRLEAFKLWKRTGQVPSAHLKWKPTESGVPAHRVFGSWQELKGQHTRSETPLTFVSGGSTESLRNAAARPMSSIDHPVYVPGQTEVATRGLYAVPEKEVADALPYVGRGVGEPAIAKFHVPQSQVVQQGYQTVIPSNARGLHLVNMNSPAAYGFSPGKHPGSWKPW